MDQEKRQLDTTLKEEHASLATICAHLKQLGCKTAQAPTPLKLSASSPINGVNSFHSKSPTPASPTSKQMSNGSAKRQSDKQRSYGSTSSQSNLNSSRTDGTGDPSINIVRIRQCAECKKSHDQHLMAHCDTCGKHYHLACLDPPLTKLPKKTSQCGWECSKCFEARSDSSDVEADVDAPRQLRLKRKPVVRFTAEAMEDLGKDFL